MLYKCDICNYSTKRLCDLRRHESRKIPCTKESKDKLCDEEQKNIDDEAAVDHTTELKCNMCNKIFKSSKGLKQHVQNCNGLHPLQCVVCLKMFKSAAGKSQHKKYVKCSPPSIHQTINTDNSINIDNSVNNNLHIHLPCNFDQISKETILNIVRELGQSEYIRSIRSNLESGKYVIPRTMDQIYFNDKFPTMQVLKKERRNDKMVEVYVGNGLWEKRLTDDISKTLISSVEDYHAPYIQHMGEKHKDVEIGTAKWKQLMRPLRTMGNTMVWFEGFKGHEFAAIGIELNHPDEDDKDDEKEMKRKSKAVAKLINEAIYNNSGAAKNVTTNTSLLLT